MRGLTERVRVVQMADHIHIPLIMIGELLADSDKPRSHKSVHLVFQNL